jgi:hypothetical protein
MDPRQLAKDAEQSGRQILQSQQGRRTGDRKGNRAMASWKRFLYKLRKFVRPGLATEYGARDGAQQSRVLRTMLGEVTILIGIGLAIGLAATAGATRFVASLLYGVRPNDPSTLSVTAATLAFVAVIAGFLPARRASRLDPMDALREE